MAHITHQNLENTYKENIVIPKDQNILFQISVDHGSFFPKHWHYALEVIYVLEGQSTITVNDTSYPLGSGQFMFINSGLVHSSRCRYKNRAILMQIPDEFLASYLPDISSLWFSVGEPVDPDHLSADTKCFARLLLAMMELKEAAPAGYKLKFHQLLFEFLDTLYQKFRCEIPDSFKPISRRSISRLDAVIAYTQQNYAKPITLETVAGVAALQREYFCRFFHQNMGMTYLEYLNDYRLSKFYNDLIMTDCSIQELEEKHGFTNQKLLYRLFKEQFHTTPLKARFEAQITK